MFSSQVRIYEVLSKVSSFLHILAIEFVTIIGPLAWLL